jgi:hypothetical protein
VAINRTVGSDDALNAHYAQLGVVLEAVSYIRTLLPRTDEQPQAGMAGFM